MVSKKSTSKTRRAPKKSAAQLENELAKMLIELRSELQNFDRINNELEDITGKQILSKQNKDFLRRAM